jgi:deoxyribonuclease-4
MFGSHLSIAGGLVNALVEAEKLKLDTVQVFTKNQRQWSVPPLDPAAAAEWLAELKRLGWTDRTVAHDSYLINLASPDDELWERSIRSMREEIERAAALSIPFLVSHPGAHMIKDGPLAPAERIEAGLRRIARAYQRLCRETRGVRVTICLENTAGGGTTLGRRFEELARLRELIVDAAGTEGDQRIGFCIDTCHALAAGYDLAAAAPDTGKKRSREQAAAAANSALHEFDRVCGLGRLRVMHLNDSLGAFDSRVDRHAHIGKGHVALGAFEVVVNHPALKNVPKILETPKEDGPRGIPMDTVNLRKLRSLLPKDEPDTPTVRLRRRTPARR